MTPYSFPRVGNVVWKTKELSRSSLPLPGYRVNASPVVRPALGEYMSATWVRRTYNWITYRNLRGMVGLRRLGHRKGKWSVYKAYQIRRCGRLIFIRGTLGSKRVITKVSGGKALRRLCCNKRRTEVTSSWRLGYRVAVRIVSANAARAQVADHLSSILHDI
ncbi:hypothetical protein DENSPDRAFT_532185 [Dentipellis sp. KUC8613]|nr:hypothetical protein DENSPDRAFT_532185 [Dentipellis sp. KUC8613]